MSDKFLVLWTEYTSRVNVNRWQTFNTEHDVVAFLRKQDLADDDDVMIIPPELAEDAVTAPEFMSQYA